jgi:hypothetical protein
MLINQLLKAKVHEEHGELVSRWSRNLRKACYFENVGDVSNNNTNHDWHGITRASVSMSHAKSELPDSWNFSEDQQAEDPDPHV